MKRLLIINYFLTIINFSAAQSFIKDTIVNSSKKNEIETFKKDAQKLYFTKHLRENIYYDSLSGSGDSTYHI